MTPATLPQADLFGDLDEAHAAPARRLHGKPGGTERAARRRAALEHEAAARLLDASDDYRVLRRLRPREVVADYRPGALAFLATRSASSRAMSRR